MGGHKTDALSEGNMHVGSFCERERWCYDKFKQFTVFKMTSIAVFELLLTLSYKNERFFSYFKTLHPLLSLLSCHCAQRVVVQAEN